MDLSILKTVNKPEAIAPEDYVAPKDYSEAVPKNDYIVRVINGKFKDDATKTEDPFRLSKTKAGDLQVEVALEIQDGDFKGKRLYDRVNIAPFKTGNKGNTFFNFLMAFGNGTKLNSPEDYIKSLDRAIKGGSVAKVFVDREWYCNPNSKEYQGCGTSTKGDTGTLRIKCTGTAHPEGTAPTLLARNIMSKYRTATLGQG